MTNNQQQWETEQQPRPPQQYSQQPRPPQQYSQQPPPPEINPPNYQSIPGYKPNVFPREHLTRDETLMWEGKPQLVAYLIKPILFIIFAVILLSVMLSFTTGTYVALSGIDNSIVTCAVISLTLFTIMAWLGAPWALFGFLASVGIGLLQVLSYVNTGTAPQTIGELRAMVVITYIWYLLFGIIYLLVEYLSWSKTSFAITDRRVMTEYGVFSRRYADCNHDKIQNVSVTEPLFERIFGYGTLLFATAGISGGIRSKASKIMASGGGVFWNALPEPTRVRQYTDTIIQEAMKQHKIKEYHMMAQIMKDSGQQMPGAPAQQQQR